MTVITLEYRKEARNEKYKIKVIETLSKVVEVEAEDYVSAFEKVEDMVNCEDIILTADDLKVVNFILR